jgi:hypothetical protein
LAAVALLGVLTTWRRPASWLGFGTLVVLPLLSFSGFFVLETERIWIFFVPALAIAAGAHVSRCAAREGRSTPVGFVIIMLVVATLIELTYKPYV